MTLNFKIIIQGQHHLHTAASHSHHTNWQDTELTLSMAGLWQSAVLVAETFCQQDNVRLCCTFHILYGMAFTYTCLQVLWLLPFWDWIYVNTRKRLKLGQWRNTHMHTHMFSCLLPCKLPPFSGPAPDTPTAINSCSFCLLILVQLKVNLKLTMGQMEWGENIVVGYSL